MYEYQVTCELIKGRGNQALMSSWVSQASTLELLKSRSLYYQTMSGLNGTSLPSACHSDIACKLDAECKA